MQPHILYLLTAFTTSINAQTHGQGDEGTVMGPVAFLWPSDRPWDAKDDNIAPCGSASGPTNRTIFPLSQGSVALSIADEAYKVAFRLALSSDPKHEEDFDDQVVNNITEIAPGHQCYKLDSLEGISSGTNATIQLEYWAEYEGENNGKNESFFACADITFVETKNFNLQVPCFNVTSDTFTAPTPSSSKAVSMTPTTPPSKHKGLSGGAIAGISVGVVVAALLIFGAAGFLLWRRGRNDGLKGKQSYELRAKTLTTPESERPAQT